MCRNIRVLHNFEPPSTPDEMRAAALQYVRKVSGLNKPTRAETEIFERTIDEITASTAHLLSHLHERIPHRTREGEQQKARERWQKREARLRS